MHQAVLVAIMLLSCLPEIVAINLLHPGNSSSATTAQRIYLRSVYPGTATSATTAQRIYLSSVYPGTATRWNSMNSTELDAFWATLTYFYHCPVARANQPDAICTSIIAESPLPRPPYLPPGAYFKASPSPKKTRGPQIGECTARSAKSLFRAEGPIAGEAMTSLRSSLSYRRGPAPSWTSPLAAVRYALFPLGFPSELVAVSSPALGDSALSTAVARSAPPRFSKAAVVDEAALRRHPTVGALLALQHGDAIEVERWGGAMWLDGVLGAWFTVWKGTGTWLRVSHPLVSFNKLTAIVDMLRALGEVDGDTVVGGGSQAQTLSSGGSRGCSAGRSRAG